MTDHKLPPETVEMLKILYRTPEFPVHPEVRRMAEEDAGGFVYVRGPWWREPAAVVALAFVVGGVVYAAGRVIVAVVKMIGGA
jgi:hypothetical protein